MSISKTTSTILNREMALAEVKAEATREVEGSDRDSLSKRWDLLSKEGTMMITTVRSKAATTTSQINSKPLEKENGTSNLTLIKRTVEVSMSKEEGVWEEVLLEEWTVTLREIWVEE